MRIVHVLEDPPGGSRTAAKMFECNKAYAWMVEGRGGEGRAIHRMSTKGFDVSP